MKKLLLLLLPIACLSQQTAVVDFQKVEAMVVPDAATETISGTVNVAFKMLEATDSVYLDAVGMKLTQTALESVAVRATADKIWFTGAFEKGREYTAFFTFEATPKQALYFTGNQIWTQGQGKYTSHWLPSLDDMNDKIEFDLTVRASKEKTVVANGVLVSDKVEGATKDWKFDMQQPMSSYLVAFAVGNFQKHVVRSESGIPIELYVSDDHISKMEPTYRYTKEIFDFLESEIGVPYPWQNYKQVPVRDFLYAGMENTTATIFSEAFVVDSIGFSDRNYVNVNAHELAHQWFGNLVTETAGTHHWLQEGFATYYALLAERALFGEDYYYWKLYNSAEQLKALSDQGQGQSLLDPKASSLIFYEKGAWALHMLNELIGDVAFKSAIKTYLETNRFDNVNTENFLDAIRKSTKVDITSWEKDWLQQTAFKAEQAFDSLLKSSFINEYFEIARLSALPLEDKKIPLTTALTFPDDFIGQQAVAQLADEPIAAAFPLYQKAFESGNVFVRQAIALSVAEVPAQLQSYYETLLEDPSYVTQEAALFTLWSSFPERRTEYLDKMEGVIGFQDRNIEQLWLALAIVTPHYRVTEKETFKRKLIAYTSRDFSFEIRQKAFEYVNELELYSESVLRNLVNASVHHNWRFRNASRLLLEEALKTPSTAAEIQRSLATYSGKEQAYLRRILE